jgi:autotransporter translocation and assembly factor TamB
VLSRILIAAALAAVLISGGAVAFLRTDFVANNLCAYAVATIEEATAAQVTVSRCQMLPESGRLTIEGLRARDAKGRIDLKIARIFAEVHVRPILQRVQLKRLEVDYPELKLALDQGTDTTVKGGQCLPDVLDRFELGRVQVRKASVDVSSGGVHVQVPRATVRVNGAGGQLSARISTRGGSVEVLGRVVGLVSTKVTGVVDLRGVGSVTISRADVIGTDASAFVKGALQDLCNPHIEAAANLHVDDLTTASARLIPGMLKGVSGGLALDATVAISPGKLRVKGDLKLKALALEGYSPGDARLHFDVTPQHLKVDKLEIPVAKGAVAGSVQIDFADHLPVSADLKLSDVELGELLRKLGQPHSLVTLHSSGRVQARGALSPLQLNGDANLDVENFAVLDQSYEKRGKAKRMFEFARGKLSTTLAVNVDRVDLRKISLDVGGSHLSAETTFFTDMKRGLQLLAHAETFSLADFKDHIGPLPARGRLAFDAQVSGPYHALVIGGSVKVSNANLLDLKLGEVSTQVTFESKNLHLLLDGIEGRKDRSFYRGRIALDLNADGTPMEAHLELPDAYVHDLVDLSVGLVPALSSVNDIGDVDGHLSAVIDAKGPVRGPDGTLKVIFDNVSLWGEQFSTGTARVVLHGQEPRLAIDYFSLEHGKAKLQLTGSFGPDWKLDMDAHTDNFDLADLDLARAAKLTGPMIASAHLGGLAQHVQIGSSMQFQSGKAGRALLGDGDFSLTVDGESMKWQGVVGTHQLQGESTLAGTFPYTCTATVRVPELHKYVELFWPETELQSGSLTAGVLLKGSLLKWRESTGTITLTHLKVARNEMEFENDGPTQIDFGPFGLRVDKLSVRAPYTTAQLSGSGSSNGKLDLRLAASVDGRLLTALVPDIEHASGTVLIQASVGGTIKAPTVLGNLRLEDASGSLRDVPVQARNLNGSISFSQDALVIDSLAGKLNNGEARLSGGMEMAKLVPSKLDLVAHMSDVNIKLRDDLSGIFDGDLTLEGPPLEPTLGGSLIVSHMKYVEDLDLEKSLLDFSRRPPTPKVLTKSALLLHYDLDVHLSRGVRVENNLARADLKGDLKVTGTSRSLGLLGSVNTVHGTASFRGNEFQIEQGVLNFSDRQRIRPSFDFQATATIKGREGEVGRQEYKVRLHGFGTPAEPHLALSSDPALAEADLGFLLTFGFVSRDLQQASFSANDAGLAIGVEALNKVTGFSEEVRRFIPKNPIVRDPNIDFVSDFSVATNRLEPMARFSSHLVTDRLDLKVLEGLTTRRYRGVLGYQLTDSVSTRLQLDNEHIYTGVDTDFGVDLHFKWEGE